MNKSLKRQQGFTVISMIFMFMIAGFLVLLVLKIGPIYIDHSKVLNALAALEKTPDIETFTEPEVRANLDKRFNMNYVYDVAKDDIHITQGGNYLKVVIQYEVIKKIAGNLSVLVEFSDEIEVGQQ